MSFHGQITGLPKPLNLLRGFEKSKFGENGTQVGDVTREVHPQSGPQRMGLFQEGHDLSGPGASGKRMPHDRPPFRKLQEAAVELRHRIGGVGAVDLSCAFGSHPGPVPYLSLAIPGLDEEREISFRVSRCYHCRGMGFVETGEVEEVGVLAERKVHVGVSQHRSPGHDHRQPVGAYFLGKSPSVVSMRVFHLGLAVSQEVSLKGYG